MPELLKQLPTDAKIIEDTTPLKSLPTDAKILTDIDNTQQEKQKVAFENASQIIDNIPNISGYQKNLVKDLTQKGAKPEQLSEAIQRFQKQNEKDIHVWSDKPEMSYGEYAINKLASGSAQLGSMLAKTPAMAYDVASMAMNKSLETFIPKELIDKYNIATPYSTDEDNLLFEKLPENKIAKFYDESVKVHQDRTAEKYDKSISEYIANGDYANAVGSIGGAVLESAPTTISLMMGNAAGIGEVGSTIGGGLVFAAGKKDELDKDEKANHLSQEEKINIAMSNGLFEGLFEQFGITKLGGLTKNILLRDGKEEAKRLAIDGFKNVYIPAIKTFVGTSLAEESIGEAATQFAQNAVDKYSGYKPELDLMEGVVDAAIVGAASGGVMGAIPAGLEVKANKRANKYAEIIQQEDKIAKENIKSEHAFHVSQQGEETVAAFESNVDMAIANGNLTLEEGEKAKHRVRAYQKYEVDMADVKADDKVKRKIFDLSYQKQGLQTEVPEDVVEKDMSPIELAKRNAKQKQIKDLQKDIDALILSGNEEIVVAKKTAEDIKKNEEKEKETELAQRLKDKSESYKDPGGYLPPPTKRELRERAEKSLPLDTRKMTEVNPVEFNEEKGKDGKLGYNFRTKYSQMTEHVDSTPDGKVSGVLKLKKVKTEAKSGDLVDNTVIDVELGSGHKIRSASSMVREEGGFRGWFMQEHLPNKKKLSDNQIDKEIDNLPVVMKVVKTTPGIGGEHTAIKVYSAETGKFLTWGKATTKGLDAFDGLTPPQIENLIKNEEAFDIWLANKKLSKKEAIGELKRREDLNREAARIEPIDNNGESLPPTDTKTPPVKPINTPTNEVKTDVGTNQKTETTKAETTEKPISKEERQIKENGLKSKMAAYNNLGKVARKSPEGKSVLADIHNSVKEAGYEVRMLSSGSVALINSKGKKVYKAPIVRSTNAIQAEKDQKALDKKILNAEPTSVEHQVVMDIANGVKFNQEELIRITGVKAKEIPLGLTQKDGGTSFEFYKTRLAEHGLDYGEDVDTVEIGNEAAEIVETYTGTSSFREAAKTRATEIYERMENQGLTNKEIAEMEEEYADPNEEPITDEFLAEREAQDKARKEAEDKGLIQKQKAAKGNLEAEHHERILKVAQHIQKVLPKVKVKYNSKLQAAGRLKGNVLEINPYFATEDTPIHEAAHVLLDAIGHDNKVIQAALKQIKASKEGAKMWEVIQNDEHYSKLSVEGQENELLAEAIGLEGKGIFDTEIEKSRFKTFLDYIFDWFKRKLGLEKNIAKSLARQIIGGRGLKNLTGIDGKTKEQIVGEKAKLKKEVRDNKKLAELMEIKGHSPLEIKLATGFERGVDGKWRYELGDESAKLINSEGLVEDLMNIPEGKSRIVTLTDVLEYKELYELYPQLKNVQIEIYNEKDNKLASHNKSYDRIRINANSYQEYFGKVSANEVHSLTNGLSGLRRVIFHELQHAIQSIEGQQQGGNPEIARKILEKEGKKKSDFTDAKWNDLVELTYRKLAGEVEANNVEKRSKLSDKEKKETLLEETEEFDRAEQILSDTIGGEQNAKYQRPTKAFERTSDDEVQKFNEFRQDQWSRDIEKENEDIEWANEVIKDKNSTPSELKQAQGLKENILNRIREDKKQYLEYKNTVQTTEDLLKEDTLEDFTKEELIEAYWSASYQMDNDSPLFKAAQTRIAIALENEQIKELQKTNPDFEKGNDEDISPIFKIFKALSDAPGKYPSLQALSLALDEAFLAKRQEATELKVKHEKLAKAVIAEKNKKLGIVKGFGAGLFSSNSAKYFEFVDNGKGQVLTKEEAEDKNLSKTQTEYLDYFRELNDKRNAAYDENDNLIQNDIIKIDPKFREQWKQGGFISALNAYLTGATDLETEIETSEVDPATKTKIKKAYGDVQQELDKGKGSLPGKIIKAYGIAFKARKAAGIDTKKSSINYRGALTLKSDKPRPKDRGYSKDFYAAANSLIDNYTHVKHMTPLIPLFDSVQQLYKQRLSKESEIVDFIESELQDKIYQNQGVGKLGVKADAVAKFFRNLGSLTTMAFNIPANIVNIGIGNYSNLRKEGLTLFLKGNGRMFIGGRGTKKVGELAISKKALDILEMFNVVHPDFDSNPQMKLGGAFNKLAYFFNQIGEYQISGSMFLGHMTKEEYNSFELKDGKYQLKPSVDKKAFDKKMQSYKDKVSGVQGKYDEKDRRRFMRTELGKAVAQYKTWMPDWVESRFGYEELNKYGEKKIGSVRSGLKVVGKKMTFKTLTKEGISELMSDVSKGIEFDRKTGRLKNREFAANLNGAIAVAAIYLAINSGDDDKDKKRKKYHETLSLEGAMGNLMFIYDPEQLIYLIEHPVAIQGTIVNFIKALDSALHGDAKQAKKLLIKSTPYGKAYTTYDKYLSSDKK